MQYVCRVTAGKNITRLSQKSCGACHATVSLAFGPGFVLRLRDAYFGTLPCGDVVPNDSELSFDRWLTALTGGGPLGAVQASLREGGVRAGERRHRWMFCRGLR